MRQPPWALGSAAVFALAATCDASAFSARLSWSGISACGRNSPAFTISDTPKETASLRFTMRDRDAPHFKHGGGVVPYAGAGSVPEGALTYVGPCPPAGARHLYVRTIEALDKEGRILSRASVEGIFPP